MGTPLTATIDVKLGGTTVCPGGIANLEVFNAATDKVFANLEDGKSYCFPPSWTINACPVACKGGEIKRVYFELYKRLGYSSNLIYTYNDTTKPYFSLFDTNAGGNNLFGNNGTLAGPLADGTYTIIVTPIGNYGGLSFVPGENHAVTFEINCDTPARD